MTEQEWLLCTVPDVLFTFLMGKASERKFQLFASACCHRLWWQLLPAESRAIVTAIERYTDRRFSLNELKMLAGWANISRMRRLYEYPAIVAPMIVNAMAQGHSWEAAHHIFEWRDAEEGIRACNLLRDIIGDYPGRHSSVETSWPAWNDGTLIKLAQAIYNDRAFDCLPILADALEEAGCIDADILNHCRQPGEHVRGCWVVDLLLGKN